MEGELSVRFIKKYNYRMCREFDSYTDYELRKGGKRKMRIKKSIAGIMAVATITATMAGASVATAADGKVGVAINNTTAKAGEPFTLSLNLSDIPETGIQGVDLGIKFDTSLVTVSEVKTSTLAATGASDIESGDLDPFYTSVLDEGLIGVSWAVASDDSKYYMKGEGEFLTISGTVSKDAKAGSKAMFSIVPVDRKATGSSSETIKSLYLGYINGTESVSYEYTLTDGYVEILGEGDTESTEDSTGSSKGEATLYGDVNEDGEVDLQDLVSLAKYFADGTAYGLSPTGLANADVEYDGTVGNADAVKLLKHLSDDTIVLGPEKGPEK